ncbi:ribokinase [Caproiciproducens sp. NJN-50]|uniref:ribokinase n=1 Tax=Acutalibacteraceae TaxID=3082771 RepID=UPI000FFE04AA|nr:MULTISPECIES: ribokinase [Acutalibacteraceae]QAT50040.1 ribokinase [Caproiciproducens sp. NJN-50]
MKILCFGSMNFDHIYNVSGFVSPGETCSALSVENHCGGKGFNQAVAVARAGRKVCLAGCIGTDGAEFLEKCAEIGVDSTYIRTLSVPTGSAVIQIDRRGENCILLFGGANQAVSRKMIDETLTHFGPGDVLIVQNEISNLSYLIGQADRAGLRIALNPSPMNEGITEKMLETASWLFVNEVEARQIAREATEKACLGQLQRICPRGTVVMTMGKNGVYCVQNGEILYQDAFPSVKPVDTTAAGDTFTGYFLAAALENNDTREALRIAAAASALSITKKGAFDSIPTMAEVAGTRF